MKQETFEKAKDIGRLIRRYKDKIDDLKKVLFGDEKAHVVFRGGDLKIQTSQIAVFIQAELAQLNSELVALEKEFEKL